MGKKERALLKYEKYYESIVSEDQDDVKGICDMAHESIYHNLHISLTSEKDGLDSRIIGCIFSLTFDSILAKLKGLEETKNSEVISIANRFEVGFDTTEDERDEKTGNYMIFIRDCGTDKLTNMPYDPNATSIERAVKWIAANVEDNIDMLKEIATDAKNRIDELDIYLASSEMIIPIFVITYECIVNYLRIKRHEKDELDYEINFCSCFDIGAREGKDDVDTIVIIPNINCKLYLKDDEKASSKYD